MKVYKYQGCGNDFVVVDNRDGKFAANSKQVTFLCHRRFGVGADGLMLLEEDSECDFKMRYFNCDGAESTMCGNGGRCIALFAHHMGIGSMVKNFKGIDGIHSAQLYNIRNNSAMVCLEMSNVAEIEKMGDDLFLNTGSPHYVHFCAEPEEENMVEYGRSVRYGEVFAAKGGTNVDLVKIIGEGEIYVRTYERGVEDETLSCGTGVTAAAIAAAIKTNSQCRRWKVTTRGGVLTVEFELTENGAEKIYLTGSAVRVLEGDIDYYRTDNKIETTSESGKVCGCGRHSH
ncbi:MAG: diaminopimelate epimerase [Rikenellaceae bacterium]|nr:diaminopimelate epimerase [Rikenellaceae bacterium]